MALPFAVDTTYGSAYHSVVTDADNILRVWRKDLARESLNQQQFAPFMGEGPLNIVQHLSDLEGRQGIHITKSLLKSIALSNLPYQGDRDTHNLEVKITDSSETVTLKEWRLPAIEGRAERQLPQWNYTAETRMAIERYVAQRKDLHILKHMMGMHVLDGDSYVLYDGETPTNVVYPKGTTNLATITASHILTPQQVSRAAEVMETGYSNSTTQIFTGTTPAVGGLGVRGVCFIHPYCKYDIRWNEDKIFENWMADAEIRGGSNPIWKGIPDKFMIDGILYVTLRQPIDAYMIQLAGATDVWGGTGGDVPGANVALNIYCTAQAILRATSMEDILDFENWDGNQFTRVIGGSYEGLTKCRYARGATTSTGHRSSDGTTAETTPTQYTVSQTGVKDWGVVIVPAAAYHHND